MTTSQPSVADTVRSITVQQLNLTGPTQELGTDDDLWARGMTSLTCLGLMLAIEDSLAIEFPEEALKESTFHSVATITAAIEDAQADSPVPVAGSVAR